MFTRDFVSKLYFTKKNKDGEWLLTNTPTLDVSSDEYRSDTYSLSNHSGQEYNLSEDFVNNHNFEEEDWNESGNKSIDMGFDQLKHCYSTPMNKNHQHNVHLNNKVSSITEISSLDLYKTATEFSKSEYVDADDMEISSSFNSSIIIDECKVYNDFVKGRNSSTLNDEDVAHDNIINDNTVTQNTNNISSSETESDDMEISSSFNSSNIIDDCKDFDDYVKGRNNSTIHEEDISKIESSLTLVSNSQELFNIYDVANDNTVIQSTSDISPKNNHCSGNIHKLKSKNYNVLNISTKEEDNKIYNQPEVCRDKTLFD